jgi:hypothetical protein
MQVVMLRNPRSDLGCNLKEGDVGEVADSLGAELINLRIAQEVERKEIFGVAKPPKISKAEKQSKPKGENIE